MNWNVFQRQYPHTASLLPSNFLTAADPDNELRRTIERDRTDFLDLVECLVTKTPAGKIIQGSYQNTLTRKDSFAGFYSELRAYVLADQFCHPIPTDIAGGDGLPDFACNSMGRSGVDIEVTRLSNWDKMVDVQETLEDKFNDTPYTPIVNYLDPFFVMPYGYQDIRANEIFTENIIDQIQRVNPQSPPSVIENHGIEIEVRRTGACGGVMGQTTAREFPLDPEGALSYRLREKAEKQRGYRPLIIVLDSRLPFLDPIDLKELLLGTSVARIGGTVPAPQIQQSSRLWYEYMQNNGVLNIPIDEVGLFAQNKFSKVAGVIFIDISEKCYYIPNCYSNDLEVKDIHQQAENEVHGLDFYTLI